MVKVLAIGDIVGKPGRLVLLEKLADFRLKEKVDFCVANGENAAGGSGLTHDTAKDLFKAGVDLITTGDHVWKKKEIIKILTKEAPILRPVNYPEGTPGKGFTIFSTANGCDIAVILALGRVFMDPIDCPFQAVDRALSRIGGRAKIILVDMHAEATSEKVAMGYHLDSRVSVVFGTHTHIQTADERILPGGTAYITDLGMTGPIHSVLGRRVDRVLKRFITGLPSPFDVSSGPAQINGALIEIDATTGKAQKIERVNLV
ncbi:MAG: TIGR00282 family metallophosphoesterase [Planctomycetota bacterium]